MKENCNLNIAFSVIVTSSTTTMKQKVKEQKNENLMCIHQDRIHCTSLLQSRLSLSLELSHLHPSVNSFSDINTQKTHLRNYIWTILTQTRKRNTKIGQIYCSVGAIQWNYPRRLNMCLESQVPNSTKINRLNPACITNSNPISPGSTAARHRIYSTK